MEEEEEQGGGEGGGKGHEGGTRSGKERTDLLRHVPDSVDRSLMFDGDVLVPSQSRALFLSSRPNLQLRVVVQVVVVALRAVRV